MFSSLQLFANIYYFDDQVIPEEVVQTLLVACRSGNFDLVDREVNNIIAEGYPVAQMLCQVLLLIYIIYPCLNK